MDPVITSLQNRRVKDVVHLRERRQRERQGRFVIDGLREIERALAGGVQFDTAFYCEDLGDERSEFLLRQLAAVGAEMVRVSSSVFAKLAFGDRTEGVVAVAVPPQRTLDDLTLDDDALVVVLESVEKPGNIGAVLRSADAVGANALIVAGSGADLYNPNTIRASLGAVFTVPACHADPAETQAWLQARGLAIFAARVDGAVDYAEVSYRESCALVLGSEAHGLSELWQGDAVQAVSLPMLGVVDSLNVSTTAAVLLYEATRQRRAK